MRFNYTNLDTSTGVLGGRSGGIVSDGAGQTKLVGIRGPLLAFSFCIKSDIVTPSGCDNCSNFLLRLTVT